MCLVNSVLLNLNSGQELEIRIWDERDTSISPAAFEAIAFCELLMRSVKRQLASARTVLRRSGVKHHLVAPRFRKNRNANWSVTQFS
jgi:hypothetical protein